MKSKPYPKYKPSGIEWLGDVPEHWEVKRLKYLSQVVMGQSPASDDYTTDPSERPFLQGNAEFGVRYPSARWYCDAAAKVVRAGALLLSVRAPVGALNEADQAYGIGRELCGVLPETAILEKDFAWFMLQVVREQLATEAKGSTYEAVSADVVGNIIAVVPRPDEQRTIADFLDRETAKSVLIVVRGMILAHSLPVAITDASVTINQDMKALTVGKRVDAEFLLWLLTGIARIFVALADESAHGTRKLESEIVARVCLAVPPTNEQMAIAGFLDRETAKIDAMATKIETAIERLREYRTVLITAAVTGKIDVRGAVA